MLAFLESVGGLGFAILGAALTAGLCCIGSVKTRREYPGNAD